MSESTTVLSQLVEILRLERIEENLFRGQSQDLGWGRIFGGQVLGQALSAAAQTVPEGRFVHSLHAYFLRVGDASAPVVYQVDPIRDGKSFTTRRVVAVQKGKPIFNFSASFQIDEEGFDHQSQMPEGVPAPETLLPESELAARYLAGLPEGVLKGIPPVMRERFTAERPIELRPIDPINPMNPGKREPVRRLWMKANGKLVDDRAVHQYLLAYASDFHLLGTTMTPHGVTWLTPGMQVASLDHAMWFHRPFRADEWILYDLDAPSAQGARGLARGRFFSQDGTLIAETAQEGLIRNHRR